VLLRIQASAGLNTAWGTVLLLDRSGFQYACLCLGEPIRCSGVRRLLTSVVFSFSLWRASQQMLQTHRSLEAYFATLWWSWVVFFSFFPCNGTPVERKWQGKTEVLGGGGTFPNATFFTTNPTWTDLGSNPGLRTRRQWYYKVWTVVLNCCAARFEFRLGSTHANRWCSLPLIQVRARILNFLRFRTLIFSFNFPVTWSSVAMTYGIQNFLRIHCFHFLSAFVSFTVD
jgi:hypothetical protein